MVCLTRVLVQSVVSFVNVYTAGCMGRSEDDSITGVPVMCGLVKPNVCHMHVNVIILFYEYFVMGIVLVMMTVMMITMN